MRWLLLLFVLPLLALSTGALHADEDECLPEGMTAKEVKKLKGKLRSKASDWWRHRKRMVMVCPQCKGRGQVRWRQGRRIAMVDCPKCDGNKIHVDKDMYRYCFYDRRSPEYRLQEGIRKRLTEEYVKVRSGNPFPVILKKYAIKDVEIVDATHGIVYVEQNKDSVARPQRWIWSQDRGKSATWYLYEANADGLWPTDEEALRPTPEVEPEPEPVEPDPQPEVEPEPEPEPETPPISGGRVTMKDSLELVERWTAERTDIKARLIRIRLGLDELEGYEDKKKTAREFLAEIDGWIEESQEAYDRAVVDTKENKWGIALHDRITVNTRHFSAHRRLELVENMLKHVIPDLR